MASRKPFLLRLDPRIHEALLRWARDELRSVNAQIEFVLREALARSGRWRPPGRGDPENLHDTAPGDATGSGPASTKGTAREGSQGPASAGGARVRPARQRKRRGPSAR